MSWQNRKRASWVAGALACLVACVGVAYRMELIRVGFRPGPPLKTWTNSLGMKFVRIEPGKFIMGSNEGPVNEQPPHLVEITRPFSFGDREVTQRQYLEVMGVNPSINKGSDDLPVEMVSWLDAVTFCNKLSEKEGRTPCYRINGEVVNVVEGKKSGLTDKTITTTRWIKGEVVSVVERIATQAAHQLAVSRLNGEVVIVVEGNGYRLPTEAEWEHACRAGSTTRYPFGDNEAALGAFAWFHGNAEGKPHPVGQKRANPWGLYDTLGNVWEWCQDGCDAGYYATSPPADPPGPTGATSRVFRGGGFDDEAPFRNPSSSVFRDPECFRPAYRDGITPESSSSILGFRLAASASAGEAGIPPVGKPQVSPAAKAKPAERNPGRDYTLRGHE